MITAKDFLLTVQKQSRTFKALPIQEHFSNIECDIQNTHNFNGQEVKTQHGSVILTNQSGRTVWLKQISELPGDYNESFLRPLYNQKVRCLEEFITKTRNPRILVMRAPGEDLLLQKLKDDSKWRFGQAMTVVLALGFPLRVTIVPAMYEMGVSGHMLFNNMLVGAL